MSAKAILVGMGICIVAHVSAQQDTLSRSVTVEREFQPVIQSAGKLNVSPERLKIQDPKVEIQYSEYTATEGNYFNAKPVRFPSRPFPTVELPNGILEGGFGHVNTMLNFRYQVPVKGKASKGVKLNLFANHDAEWGVRTWEKSALGMDFQKQFSELEVYFDVVGKNHFYTRYGRYFIEDNNLSVDRFSELNAADKQNIWTAATNVGIRSRKNADILYHVQTGYQAYVLPDMVAEHQIRSEASVEWNGDEHHAGADIAVRNAFYSIEENLWLPTDTNRRSQSRHGIRIHPFYKYMGERVRVKAGANIDLNIGKGQMMSSNEEISFAPSPDVEVEYRIIPSWLAVYAGAEGRFSYGTLDTYIDACPYRYIARSISSRHVSSYIPVDAFLGFKVRAADNLLLDIYAHYEYMKNQTVNYIDSTSLSSPYGYIHYFYSDFQRWKVGMELTYHYQDIIRILASGNYYHWTAENVDAHHPLVDKDMIYDRPEWDAHLRIDARIDQHWSLYSDNIFAGRTNALYKDGVEKTKATIDLNIGARYDFNKNIGIWLQLNNYLNRHHDIYYTYQSQGIHGLLGVSWKF